MTMVLFQNYFAVSCWLEAVWNEPCFYFELHLRLVADIYKMIVTGHSFGWGHSSAPAPA